MGALVAVNAVGFGHDRQRPAFLGRRLRAGQRVRWPGLAAPLPADALKLRFKGQPLPATATTIALVATDATLTKAECKRLAIMANDGLSKSLRPVHAPNDGDTCSRRQRGARAGAAPRRC